MDLSRHQVEVHLLDGVYTAETDIHIPHLDQRCRPLVHRSALLRKNTSTATAATSTIPTTMS
jgi:hypothetical protein